MKNEDTLLAIAFGIGTIMDLAVEEGMLTEDEAQILVRKVADRMNKEHSAYHDETGKPCDQIHDA
jgi:hypothetical protein